MGPQISQIGKIPGYFAGIPGKVPGKYPRSLPVSSVSPHRFCPKPAPRLRETRELPEWSRNGGSTNQTPSGFPGNFRKLKVLGTLWFPSGLPETLVCRSRRSLSLCGPHAPQASRASAINHLPTKSHSQTHAELHAMNHVLKRAVCTHCRPRSSYPAVSYVELDSTK